MNVAADRVIRVFTITITITTPLLLNGLNKDMEVIAPLFQIRRLGLRPLDNEAPCFPGQNSVIALPSTSLKEELVTSSENREWGVGSVVAGSAFGAPQIFAPNRSETLQNVGLGASGLKNTGSPKTQIQRPQIQRPICERVCFCLPSSF